MRGIPLKAGVASVFEKSVDAQSCSRVWVVFTDPCEHHESHAIAH
jgi:hypothetical protein